MLLVLLGSPLGMTHCVPGVLLTVFGRSWGGPGVLLRAPGILLGCSLGLLGCSWVQNGCPFGAPGVLLG